MPEFTIYSIGDSELLEQVLIAVAMITGTNDLTKMGFHRSSGVRGYCVR